MRRLATAALLVGGLAAAGATHAQTDPAAALNEGARAIRTAVMERMADLRCGDAPCAPATPAEIDNPPVTDAEARVVLLRGMLSGFGEYCGLDWQTRNFAPMMAHWRQAGGKTPRQMAIIGAIHGAGQGMGQSSAARRGPCEGEFRANLERQLDFRP